MGQQPFLVRLGPAGRGNPLVEVESTSLTFLAYQTAASVIHTCNENPPDAKRMNRGASAILETRVNWADHGLLNALLAQIGFLYALVEAQVELGQRTVLFMLDSPSIITDALSAFQAWKTAYAEALGGKYGKKTVFYRKDWTDLNERFLETLQPPDEAAVG